MKGSLLDASGDTNMFFASFPLAEHRIPGQMALTSRTRRRKAQEKPAGMGKLGVLMMNHQYTRFLLLLPNYNNSSFVCVCCVLGCVVCVCLSASTPERGGHTVFFNCSAHWGFFLKPGLWSSMICSGCLAKGALGSSCPHTPHTHQSQGDRSILSCHFLWVLGIWSKVFMPV